MINVIAVGVATLFLFTFRFWKTKRKVRIKKEETELTLTEERKKRAKRIVFWFSILTLGSGYILYIALRFLFDEMAKDKKDWLVTFRTDGEYKAIMRGDTCVRYVVKVENHLIDPEGFDTFKGSFDSYAKFLVKARERKLKDDPSFIERKLRLDDSGNPVQINGQYQLTNRLRQLIIEANTPTVFEELFGAHWVGFPPYRVFRYPYRWLSYGQAKAENGKPSGDVGMQPRDEVVDSLFFRYPKYGVVVEKTETGAGSLATLTDSKITKVQVGAQFVFETETVNSHKTLFRTAALSSAGDWQQALVREIYDRARMWLGSTGWNWDRLVEDRENVEKALLKIRDDINGVDEDGILLYPRPQTSSVGDYGQRIVKITMPQVNLTDETLQKEYENVFRAQKKRDADIAKAEGERALAAAPIQGEADGFELISKIPGGKKMYMAQQLGKIRVYAPGRDGLFLSIAEEVTGESRPPAKKTEDADSSGDSGKKK